MTIKTSRITAVSVAFAVWFAYAVPVYGASNRYLPGNHSANIAQADDDDDGLSGGALAVLLLAIGGAVAGVLYAAGASHGNNQCVINRGAANTINIALEGADANGNPKRSQWRGKLDDKSAEIKLTRDATDRAGKPTHMQWTGKADGQYYSVTGDPAVDELSFAKVDSRTLSFSAKKAGRIIETGRISLSADGRSVTIGTEHTNSRGLRLNRQTVFTTRRFSR